jgi:hypothetical protein
MGANHSLTLVALIGAARVSKRCFISIKSHVTGLALDFESVLP